MGELYILNTSANEERENGKNKERARVFPSRMAIIAVILRFSALFTLSASPECIAHQHTRKGSHKSENAMFHAEKQK